MTIVDGLVALCHRFCIIVPPWRYLYGTLEILSCPKARVSNNSRWEAEQLLRRQQTNRRTTTNKHTVDANYLINVNFWTKQKLVYL
jgi:hypothetical protein